MSRTAIDRRSVGYATISRLGGEPAKGGGGVRGGEHGALPPVLSGGEKGIRVLQGREEREVGVERLRGMESDRGLYLMPRARVSK